MMTFILFGRSPTWWPSGDAESSRFVGLPKRPGSMLPESPRRYRCGRKTVPRAVAVVWTLSRGRGCRPIRSQSNGSLFRECLHLRMCWTHKQKRAVRRRAPAMIVS